jgi:hypothetical protein
MKGNGYDGQQTAAFCPAHARFVRRIGTARSLSLLKNVLTKLISQEGCIPS